jgi:NADPH-dependent 2,4-dienoyl-CoA reductase/sulfur reductase-like enzyme
MSRSDYLIVGGGMAADAAVRGIRELDKDGSIGLLSAERHPPYSRPPLSKALWKGDPEDGIWRKTEELGLDLHLGARAVELRPDEHAVTVADGRVFTYGRLLLATGGRPRTLPGAPEDVIAFRTVDDYRRLRERIEAGARVVILGGGFIGSELAASLAARGTAVTLVVPEPAIGTRAYPEDLARSVTALFRERGVDVRTGEMAQAIRRDGKQLTVETRSGGRMSGDVVVAGLGIEPNVELAQGAGLEVGNGILVDAKLRAHPDIYAAGDVANVYSEALGVRRRVEHEDAALTMGLAAGRNMAGADEPYTHLPMFYSDLFELGYEAVGEIDSRLETSAEWQVPYREGVVQYRREGRVAGVLLWNVWGKVDEARALISGAARAASA